MWQNGDMNNLLIHILQLASFVPPDQLKKKKNPSVTQVSPKFSNFLPKNQFDTGFI